MSFARGVPVSAISNTIQSAAMRRPTPIAPVPAAPVPAAVAPVGVQMGGMNLAPLMQMLAAPTPEPTGLLGTSFNDPRTQANLVAAGALLQHSGYSTTPTTFGQGLGAALQLRSKELARQQALRDAQRQRAFLNMMSVRDALKPVPINEDSYLVDPFSGERIGGANQPTLNIDALGIKLTDTEREAFSLLKPSQRGPALQQLVSGKMGREDEYRKEWVKKSAGLSEVISAGKEVQNLLTQEEIKGSDAIRVLFRYVKALDPTSVVRESEIGLTSSAESLFQRFSALLTKLRQDSATPISTSLVRDLSQQIVQLSNNAEESLNKQRKFYLDLAKRNALNPDNILVDQVVTAVLPQTNAEDA